MKKWSFSDQCFEGIGVGVFRTGRRRIVGRSLILVGALVVFVAGGLSASADPATGNGQQKDSGTSTSVFIPPANQNANNQGEDSTSSVLGTPLLKKNGKENAPGQLKKAEKEATPSSSSSTPSSSSSTPSSSSSTPATTPKAPASSAAPKAPAATGTNNAQAASTTTSTAADENLAHTGVMTWTFVAFGLGILLLGLCLEQQARMMGRAQQA